ncbi:nitroimidazol reductase NimA-like FMN-containing flavoprotein (pyridoxamine 5'-phosphate oxidase superfamily) [Spinactinospora alkalitolerans]|uniref:Nitroimidazol reductase NimA-like FMN-containing flavoprotein (Pyridoxamine 5'-phosphate oxidase superfamily) n=1 Tax=Spinactinospora alkalitolerans TaxID=687207 RepID=A0A852U2G6_9ACTN|nr:pyridoxamine 5'-phosphate oxidase family protein [Spinactinospora alkalitolerans]NYE50418.1 nitroimidazol reductase NimA-like FMN-containing flavoprotein (pyridoxamine 5'-phosphate oxidase superfamily) [Spinactinospora alkalitolerans]
MTIDTAGLEVLERQECLWLLAAAPIGRIVFTDRALPAVQPVNFALHGADIIVRTSSGSKLARATRDAVVAFEVDDYDVCARTGWSVMVVGTGRAVTDPDEVAELERLPLRPWAPGPRSHFIRVETDIITGRRIPGRYVEPDGACG